MKRLTKKFDGYGSWTQNEPFLPAHNIRHKECVNKLGLIEDIEEELGIDLIILKKVLEHGQEKYVYFKDRNNKIHKCDRAIINIHVQVDVLDEPVGSGYFCQQNLYLDDYGKKWALDENELTREELEDEKICN